MIIPIGNKVLVIPTEQEKTTASGIILGDTQERPVTGKVVAIGAGSVNVVGAFIPMTVKVDDTVLMSKYSGIPVTYEGTEFLMFKEEELLGIVQ